MNDRLAGFAGRNDVVVIPRIRVTFALSILVHVAALWVLLPRLPLLSPGKEPGEASDRLQVQIAAQRAPLPTPALPPSPPAPARETRAILSARPRPRNAPPRETPPELVVPSPEVPEMPVPPPAAAAAVEPARTYPPIEGDLASYVEARRRARGERSASGPPAEGETERRDRIVAAAMPAPQSPIASQERKRGGGGVFEITRMAYDDAEFRFFGWNNEARRRIPQRFEVRLGDNSDMRIAIVRKMIAIIREHEQGDFNWDSWRLGRIVVLSARPSDSSGLEEFLMQEFFEGAARTPYR